MTTTNAANRYFNIKAFTVGSVIYTTVESVDIDQDAAEITDAGDNDAFLTFVAQGVQRTRVSIAIKDPVQAKALRALSDQTITFNGVTQEGGAELLVTLAGFTGFRNSSRGGFNRLYAQSVNGICVSDDGTDPYTVAPVAP